MSDWRARSVLITGCTGFVGRSTAWRLLSEGARVVGLSRRAPDEGALGDASLPINQVQFVVGDIQDPALIERLVAENQVDTVLHLAAQTDVLAARDDPLATLEANTRGTWSVLEGIRRSGRQPAVVLASSDAVYGESAGRPSSEQTPPSATSPYEVSKMCAELAAIMYARTYDLPVCIGRLSNVYGAGDLNFRRIVPGAIAAVLSGRRPALRNDGSAVRDFLFVRDAVEALLLLADSARREGVKGNVFNISSGRPYSVLEVVELILQVTGRPDLRPEPGKPALGETSRRESSSSHILSELGWAARYSLEAGVRETVDWYRTHPGLIGTARETQ
jgi:CDP-glucose 4,6-dehydratase